MENLPKLTIKSTLEQDSGILSPVCLTGLEPVCSNVYLNKFFPKDDDILYHLGFSTADTNFVKVFGDTKFVLMGGSVSRMRKMANLLLENLNLPDKSKYTNSQGIIPNIAGPHARYEVYKVGPVICVNHNIGASTISVVLHEIFKLLDHAKVVKENVHLFRIGTSGGLGINPGTIVVTGSCCDSLQRSEFQSVECGKIKKLPMKIDQNVAMELKNLADRMDYPALIGGTMGTDDFYLGQGRLDGAFASYSKDDKMEFLKQLFSIGIRNIEMETHILSAFTYRAGLKCSIVCTTIVNRLLGDQIDADMETLKMWEKRACMLVVEYIKEKLEKFVK